MKQTAKKPFLTLRRCVRRGFLSEKAGVGSESYHPISELLEREKAYG